MFGIAIILSQWAVILQFPSKLTYLKLTWQWAQHSLACCNLLVIIGRSVCDKNHSLTIIIHKSRRWRNGIIVVYWPKCRRFESDLASIDFLQKGIFSQYFSVLKVIHFPTLPSSFSSFWEMTTWAKLDINRKPISQIRFCKKILIVENFNHYTRYTDQTFEG